MVIPAAILWPPKLTKWCEQALIALSKQKPSIERAEPWAMLF
jgi:hypothetical protein